MEFVVPLGGPAAETGGDLAPHRGSDGGGTAPGPDA